MMDEKEIRKEIELLKTIRNEAREILHKRKPAPSDKDWTPYYVIVGNIATLECVLFKESRAKQVKKKIKNKS